MSEIKPDNVQRFVECLAEMPEAESPLTKRKTVALLAGAIQRARDAFHCHAFYPQPGRPVTQS